MEFTLNSKPESTCKKDSSPDFDQSILFEAKAFLCWDKFPNLSIKLIPIAETVAFFYPPGRDILTINLFYDGNADDFSPALWLLFHEAGHVVQWQLFDKKNRTDEFWKSIDLDRGELKFNFERQAWNFGEELLIEFLDKKNIAKNKIIDGYRSYAGQSLMTYR